MTATARPRPPLLRPHKTRAIRADAGAGSMETLAAEFALLAQRRARIARQVDLLDRQLTAAEAGLNKVTDRMTCLASRMEAIDPALRAALAKPPPPPPSPPPPKPSITRYRLAPRFARRRGPLTA